MVKNTEKETPTKEEVEKKENVEAQDEISEELVKELKNIVDEGKEASVEDQLSEEKDKNLRLLAEMQNMRARQQKDLKDAREYAIAGFAQDMLLILENLNRAKESIPDNEENNEIFKNIVEGIGLVSEEVSRIFTKYGIERVAPEAGEKFDYKFHQAMVQIPTDEFNSGEIVQLIHAGYTLKDRILKPAMVGVAKAKDNNQQEAQAEPVEEKAANE